MKNPASTISLLPQRSIPKTPGISLNHFATKCCQLRLPSSRAVLSVLPTPKKQKSLQVPFRLNTPWTPFLQNSTNTIVASLSNSSLLCVTYQLSCCHVGWGVFSHLLFLQRRQRHDEASNFLRTWKFATAYRWLESLQRYSPAIIKSTFSPLLVRSLSKSSSKDCRS